MMPFSEEINEECGVFGIYHSPMASQKTGTNPDASRIAFFGIFSLQHRGQESAGIATSDGIQLYLYRKMGMVNQIFDEKKLRTLKGHIAIAHTRYSTTGASVKRNIQPMLCHCKYGDIALAHNGDLVNAAEIRSELVKMGISFDTTNDSEVILKLISISNRATIEEAISDVMNKIRGAYAVVILTKTTLIAFKDPFGIRPLALGKLNGDGYAVASESCAFNTIGGELIRELEPGEILSIDQDGVKTIQGHKKLGNALCIFEYIYFARPDSVLNQVPVHLARKRMGIELAKEFSTEGCDLVFPIPNTGNQAAVGLAEESGIPYAEAVIKNHYIHRTFIRPNQKMRDMGVRMKLSPLRELLEGKSVIMVDDSIVRGTTIGKTVSLIRDAGAKEVHVRIASPMYLYPCFYGIDTCNRTELIASHMSVEEIRQHIGADSLGYLSLEGLFRAVGNDASCSCCAACLDSKYPIEVSQTLKKSKHLFD